MADFMDIITQRRTVRRFEDQPVPDDALATVLNAARWAQSWANTQCWEIVVVRDPAVRKAIEAAVPEGNPALRCIASAPVLLAICGRLGTSGYYKGQAVTKFGDWFLFDLGIATQNMALAAHALGLGSVVLGLFDHGQAKAAVGLPEGYELAALMPMGYPAKTPTAPPRREVSEFVHEDRFTAK